MISENNLKEKIVLNAWRDKNLVGLLSTNFAFKIVKLAFYYNNNDWSREASLKTLKKFVY